MRTRAPSPRMLDIALTAAILVLSVTESLLSDGVTGPRWATVLVAAAMSLLLLWRRSHPLAMAVLLVVIVVPTAATLIDPSELISTFLPLLILAYGAARTPNRARRASSSRCCWQVSSRWPCSTRARTRGTCTSRP